MPLFVLNCFVSADSLFVLSLLFNSCQINSHNRLTKPSESVVVVGAAVPHFDFDVWHNNLHLPINLVVLSFIPNLSFAVPCSIIICSDFVDHFLPLCLCLHYSCHALREPVTRALTLHAFIGPCAHTLFALALSWDQPTPWPWFEPHPPTAGQGPSWNWAQPNPLPCLNPGKGDQGGLQSQIVPPRWTRTPLKKSVSL